MSIREKILIYFSAVSITLVGIACFIIYLLFREYREEEFQMRQKEKIEITLKFLTEIRDIDDRLLEAMDRITLNDLYDEKLLIFDKRKQLIYASIDDTPIPFSRTILDGLSPENPWLEQKDGDYDVVGVFIENDSNAFYGISKAYDTFGYSQLYFLQQLLMLTFAGIAVIIVLVSFYLSKKISFPITMISRKISRYNFDKDFIPLTIRTTTKEVASLSEQFNTLMKRLMEAYSYQKHAINHISHELKTPIAILVSNFERMEKEEDPMTLQMLLREQKEDTKSLGTIIDLLLEVSKMETSQPPATAELRIDELLFDAIEEVRKVREDFNFLVEYKGLEEEGELIVVGNAPLLKMAFCNLLLNCTRYSSEHVARILIGKEARMVVVHLVNKGEVISDSEREFLFRRFFRGGNSKGTRGFGLGLVFVHKVVQLHNGGVEYRVGEENENIFTIKLALS